MKVSQIYKRKVAEFILIKEMGISPSEIERAIDKKVNEWLILLDEYNKVLKEISERA